MMKLLLLFIMAITFPACAHGKGLFTVKAADKIQAAEKIVGAEKVADKAEANFNVGSRTSETKTTVGGNQSNDSEVMKEYIQALKDSHKELVDVMWKIIGLLIIQLIGLVSAFGGYLWLTIKSLLLARDRNDTADDELLRSAIKKQEA